MVPAVVASRWHAAEAHARIKMDVPIYPPMKAAGVAVSRGVGLTMRGHPESDDQAI